MKTRTLTLLGFVVVLCGLLLVHRYVDRPVPSAVVGDNPVVQQLPRPSNSQSAELDPSSQQTNRTVEEVHTPPTDGRGSEAHKLLLVRSSIGLDLPFFELQTPEGEWAMHGPDHGKLQLDVKDDVPVQVRAPGHATAQITSASSEIVLEPDALLSLTGKDLKGCIASLCPYDDYSTPHELSEVIRPEMRRAAAWGWLSENRWVIAVSSELIEKANLRKSTDLSLRWKDGHEAILHFDVSRGARGEWTVPCGDATLAAPLEMSIVKPTDQITGNVTIIATMLDRSDDAPIVQQQPWGSVTHSPSGAYFEKRVLPQGVLTTRLDAVPRGARICVAARDETSAAYGRVVFIHDGSPHVLSLLPPVSIVGHLVPDDGVAPYPTSANIVWEFVDESESKYMWRCESFQTPLDTSGAFETKGPKSIPVREQMQLDPPHVLHLEVSTGGFELFSKTYDTLHARRFDCGEIRLTRKSPTVVLLPGHGLTPTELGAFVRTSSQPEMCFTIETGCVRADGSMEVSLSRAAVSPGLGESYRATRGPLGTVETAQWPTPDPNWIFVHVRLGDRDEDWIFQRQAGRDYLAMPRSQREVVVECAALPPNGGRWTVGWSWSGQWGYLAQIAPQSLGAVTRIPIGVPRSGASFWWSSGDRPIESSPGLLAGGSMALEEGMGKILLR